MNQSECKRILAEIKSCIELAHVEASRVLQATADRPDAVDAAHRAVTLLAKAVALREVLEELQ